MASYFSSCGSMLLTKIVQLAREARIKFLNSHNLQAISADARRALLLKRHSALLAPAEIAWQVLNARRF